MSDNYVSLREPLMPVSFTKLFISLLVLAISISCIIWWARQRPGRWAAATVLILLLFPGAAALWITLEMVCDRLGLWWL